MDNNPIQAESSPVEEPRQETAKKPRRINVKIVILLAAIIVLCVLVYVFKGLFIAAVVDGSPISRLAVIQKLEKASGKNLLDSVIIEKLIQNEASAKKISVSEAEIDREIKRVEEQIASQGGTLEAALAGQGMNLNDFKKQVILQKEVEKLLADKTNVTDEEVAQYIKDNEISIPKGQEAVINDQIKNELKSLKLNQEADALITALKSQAKIYYFVNY